MKKKQFMSKLAALTMAAAMGITALPATAVFAQTTSIEASDTKLASSDYITVKKTFNGTNADADVSQDIVNALVDESNGLDGKDLYDGTAGGNSDATTTIANKLSGVASGSWAISDLNMTDADHYSFNAKSAVSGTYNVVIAINGTDDATLTKAVDAVNATTYASPDGTTYVEATLKSKIAADLKANGFNGDVTWETGTLTPAIDATHNGVYVNTVNGKQIYVNLTYSSAQKVAATDAVIAGLGRAGSPVIVTSHDVVTTGNEVALSDVQTAKEYDFAETTALSKAIQSTKATKAVSEKDGAKALQAYIESKLAEKKIDNNGVTVSVKPKSVPPAPLVV